MADYRPDLYGRVEGPPDTPEGVVQAALAKSCPDCNVNVFIERHGDDPADPGCYTIKVAHDETCPALARREGAWGGGDG